MVSEETLSKFLIPGVTKTLLSSKTAKKDHVITRLLDVITVVWKNKVIRGHLEIPLELTFGRGEKSQNNKKKVGNRVNSKKQDRKTWRRRLESTRKG